MSFMGSIGESEAETGLLRSYYNDLEDFAGEIENVLCPAKTLGLSCKRKEGSIGWLRADSAAKVAVCFEAY